MRERKTYTEEDRLRLIAEWQASGVTITAFCVARQITASMFARWLDQRGVDRPKGASSRKRGGAAKGGNRKSYSDEEIRSILAQAYGGSGRKRVSATSRKVGCSPASIGNWRMSHPHLMPDKTEVVGSNGSLFDEPPRNALALPPPAAPTTPDPNLFEQSQADAWTELMVHLEGLSPRARLRVLSLIDKIQT